MFIPLLLIPFLVNKLGSDIYGVFATCLVTLNFLMRFTDFRINLSASRKISFSKDGDVALEYLNISLHAKLLLLLPALILFNAISYSYGYLYLHVSALLSLALICDALTPLCYYQGLQRLKTYALVCLVWRWISALLILLLVKTEKDLLLYCFLHSLSYLGIVVNLYFPIVRKHKTFSKFDLIPAKKMIAEGWQIYSSSLISSLFIPIITNFVAITNEAGVVTLFNVTQRIFSSAYRIFEPINTSVFPYLSNLYSTDKNRYREKSKLIFNIFLSASMILFLTLFAIKELVIQAFIGYVNENALLVYSICGLSLIANVMNLYILHALVIIEKTRAIIRIVFLGLASLLSGMLIIYSMDLSIVYTAIVGNIPLYLSFLLSWKIYHTEILRFYP